MKKGKVVTGDIVQKRAKTPTELVIVNCPNCIGGDPGCLVCGGYGKVRIAVSKLKVV